MDIVNERIKSYMKDPTLYRTTVQVGQWGNSNGVDNYVAFSFSDGDDIQTAEDISLAHIIRENNLDNDDITEVTTDTYKEVWQ
jgi:hypothetical protein